MNRPRACVETFAPSQLGIATSVKVVEPAQTKTFESLIVLGAQFQCTLNNADKLDESKPVKGTLRKFESLNLVAQRPGSPALADDFDPPVVTSQQLSADLVTGKVTATITAGDANGLRRIVALIYKDDDGLPGGPGEIFAVELPINDPGPLPQTYVMELDDASGHPLAFQYVDNAGNVPWLT